MVQEEEGRDQFCAPCCFSPEAQTCFLFSEAAKCPAQVSDGAIEASKGAEQELEFTPSAPSSRFYWLIASLVQFLSVSALGWAGGCVISIG